MQTLRTRHVSKKATKFKIPEEKFIEAAQRARDGIASANLGGGVIKDRIPREGQGKSGGFRTLCCLRDDGIAIFFSLFAKKDKANIDNQELQEARRIAAGFKALSEDDLRAAMAAGTLRVINEGDDDAVTETDETPRSNERDNQHGKNESLT